jgi:AcrR family transcriptional regulator
MMEKKSLSLEAKAHRRRLLEGMASSVALKGYAATTISDIVREAGVSRRTFYEQFATRSDCLIALYEAASERALTVLRSALDSQRPWQLQLERVLEAYLSSLATNPALLRTLYIEIWGLGMPGLAVRRRVNQDIAGFMMTVINQAPSSPRLTPDMALAVVGGVNELILLAIEEGRVDSLTQIASTCAALVRAASAGTP